MSKESGNLILVINSGSSSIKVTLFNCGSPNCERLFDAHLKGILSDHCQLVTETSIGKEKIRIDKHTGIKEGLKLIFDDIVNHRGFALSSISAIGHRYVHGGNRYIASTLINDEVIAELEKIFVLAPLHNEACLSGIKSAREYFGKSVPQIAVFDTAFHSNMPKKAANYAIASSLAEKYQIRRYGFHGISNAFIWSVYQKHKGEAFKNAKIIVLHLGNGCSATAIEEGRSIDTSMGFTPAEGLVMGTRAGDIDAGVVEYLCLNANMTVVEVLNELNFRSGLLGISGISSDMKTISDAVLKDGNAKLAIEMFCYRILKYLGAYIAALGGIDAIIFSGGIGENSALIRSMIIEKLSLFGIQLDVQSNEGAVNLSSGSIEKISSGPSQEVFVVVTDENLFIAKEVYDIIHVSQIH